MGNHHPKFLNPSYPVGLEMDAVGILVQRSASVVVVTAGAYVWQLYQESGLSVSPEAIHLQADLLSHATSASELIWPPTKKSAPLTMFFVFYFILVVKRTF